MSDSDNNSSDSNNGADSAPASNTPTETSPAANTESSSVSETPTESVPVATGTSTDGHAPSVPADGQSEAAAKIKVEITGQIVHTFEVSAGTSLAEIFKANNITGYSKMAFRDAKGNPVGDQRKLTESITLTSAMRTSSG